MADATPTATPAVKRSNFTPIQNSALVCVQVEPGVVLSIQKNGTLETRPIEKTGAWESGTDEGDRWVVRDPAYPTGSYVLLIDNNG